MILADYAQDFSRKLAHKPPGELHYRIPHSGPAGTPNTLRAKPTPPLLLVRLPVCTPKCSGKRKLQ